MEDAGDGEDTRDWYVTKAEAEHRYRWWLREFEEHRRDLARIEAIQDDSERYAARSELRTPWQYAATSYGYIEFVPTKRGIFDLIRSRLRQNTHELGVYNETDLKH